jgi:hypothetical protein
MDVRSNLAFSGGAKITGLPAATASGEPVTLEQLNAQIEGLSWKDAARVSTQANINLASPGGTIDGITMVSGDRVLVRVQSTGSQNGLYVWNGAASPMTRTLDGSTFVELEAAVVGVEEGTDAGSLFRQTQVNGTIDSSTVTWTSLGTSAPAATETTAGILEIATQAETDTGTDDQRALTPLKGRNASWAARRFSATFGDGSATQYDITHNLNSTDVQVSVHVVSTGAQIICDITRTGVNVVRLNFAAAPASNSLRCVVQA